MESSRKRMWTLVSRHWVAVVVAGLLAVTWGVEQLYIRMLRHQAPQALERVVLGAEKKVVVRFDAMQAAMRKRAAALAAEPTVVAVLSGETKPESLVRHVARMRLPARWSAAVYDANGTLLAWNGTSLAPRAEAIPAGQAIQWGLATDGRWRQALELWYQVPGTQGYVRLLQLLYERTPVQNEFLQDFRIGDQWSLLVGLRVRTSFDLDARWQGGTPLFARGGMLVGHFALERPQLEGLVVSARRHFRGLLALWLTALMGIGLWNLWGRYRSKRTWSRVGIFLLALWGARFALLSIRVPARWQTGKAPLSPLFDATHMASTAGGGLMGSTGDLLISALFLLLTALVLLRFAHRRYGAVLGFTACWHHLRRSPVQVARMLGVMVVGLGLVTLLGAGVRHAVLDSTVNVLSREGLLPEPLVLVIYCSLATAALAVVLTIAALARVAIGSQARMNTAPARQPAPYWIVALLLLAACVVFASRHLDAPWLVLLAFLGVGVAATILRVGASLHWLTLRGVLLVTLVVCTLLYPLLFAGLSERRHSRMEHAAASFDRGFDPSVAFALRDLLEGARSDTTIAAAIVSGDSTRLSAAVMGLKRGTLLSLRGAFDLSVRLFDARGSPFGAAAADSVRLTKRLHAVRLGKEEANAVVLSAADTDDRRAYQGVAPVVSGEGRLGWIMARAVPEVLPEEAGTPLLRTLLSSGYRDLYANLSLGSFRDGDGLLVRSIGRSFRHIALDTTVAAALQDTSALWRLDVYGDRRYEAYYLRRADGQVVGVRASAVAAFDHLYYLLRLIVAGLGIGLPCYLVGIVLRRSARMLPAKRVRFQDKVLNAFLSMAILAVIPVGIVGVRVVTEENTKAIQSWLRNSLQLVDGALASEARAGEALHHVLERISIDSLAVRMGLDFNLYEEERLIAASRSQLVRERLTDVRLPIQAYEALFLDGYKSTFVPQQLGGFRYTAGYHVLLDETGRPRYVLSVPTLPEQERIEEERARTLAYLFGALLALMMLVMLTASLLARALARPIARLQQGLQAVGQGHFGRRLPVQTRDEVGQLAQTFNDMQRQLAESRQQLALQHKQLAWREMARQVAHEIKNPLTPMKLSVQHLQRAYETHKPKGEQRFSGLFYRITNVLVKEIGALAHIANEFASFARMPARIVEPLDLREVIREVAVLMQEETPERITFEVQLSDEPLKVQADRKELKRIYVNLIKNALEAMKLDHSGAIVIVARQEGSMAVSSVSDTGCGIAPELQEKIFKPSFSTKTSGTGLGLAIARASIEDFGGTIGFEARKVRGTMFHIRLPVLD